MDDTALPDPPSSRPELSRSLQKHPEYQDLITLTDLFRHPTMAAVAAHLDQTAEQEAARRGSDRLAALHKLRSRKGTTR
ncbi:hypothetical protein ACGFSB_32060 [Streptomyces sp. NPDC048441]|uniref:hypothetical protein n=1 Tax=Streptomyces sp. NPDC048441 TaxID=3365552 RepID=UPI003721E45E